MWQLLLSHILNLMIIGISTTLALLTINAEVRANTYRNSFTSRSQLALSRVRLYVTVPVIISSVAPYRWEKFTLRRDDSFNFQASAQQPPMNGTSFLEETSGVSRGKLPLLVVVLSGF